MSPFLNACKIDAFTSESIFVCFQTHTSDGNAIYANDKDLTKEAAPDDEQLHYAHVNVIQLQARDRAEIRGLSSVTSEYAEIRLRPAESDKGEEPQADTEPDPEPDPEPEEEKMVADTPSGQEVASEDVAASTAWKPSVVLNTQKFGEISYLNTT